MSEILQYKGYKSRIYYSVEDKLLCGKIDHIKDLVSFHSESSISIVTEFHCAVDDYLKLCKEIGKEPDKPSKESTDITKTNWISVNNQLPENTLPKNSKAKVIKVLVAIKGENGYTVRTQTRFREKWDDKEVWSWRFSCGKVTHWMPLPEPPKEKKYDE